MKQKHILIETCIGFLTVGLLLVLSNTLMIKHSILSNMAITAIVGVTFLLFIGLFWKENAADEREAYHNMMAGRFAYFSGVFILMIIVLLDYYMIKVAGWSSLVLGVMILAKMVSRIWARQVK